MNNQSKEQAAAVVAVARSVAEQYGATMFFFSGK
jgi:hypothetical protein